MDLTQEQLQAAESMSLEDLKALALKEAEAAEAAPAPKADDKARDAQGKFVKKDDEPVVEEPAATEPEVTIYRKEIDNGNGVIEVFEAESLEELVDKIAEGKRNASIKIRELSAERKQTQAKTDQQVKDENYVVEQNLKTKPAETIKELARQAIEEQQEALRRSTEAQERFVAAHPDFIANPDNGNRMVNEIKTLGYNEISSESLEKAYQSLKKSGLLKLKDTEANDATETDTTVTQRITEPAAEVTQQRSPKKGSNISTRTSSRTAAPANQGPSTDDLYDKKKYSLEQIRELADKQLREANRQ